MKNRIARLTTMFGLTIATLTSLTAARGQELVCNNGIAQTINYTGSAQDFTIPIASPPSSITFTCQGAKGGSATVVRSTGGECSTPGGNGAIVQGTFAVGYGPDELRPGRQIRFIVGQQGTSWISNEILGAGGAAGDGGGGTGILYDHETNGWTPLLVAGGGGGSYQGMAFFICTISSQGSDGQAGECGSEGLGDEPIVGDDSGGCNGNGGGHANAAGGGGLYTAGQDGGGGAGWPSGGIGNPESRGWGCGGGGRRVGPAGGGGGGYSGGGGGGVSGGGGGGGSYTAPFATNTSFSLNTTSFHGRVFYQCELCPGFDDNLDTDSDGVPDGCDVCAGSDDTSDADGDGVPDGCDACPGSNDANDGDGDGVPDGCDACPGFDDAIDADNDGVPDSCDVCPGFNDASDGDGDGVPDGCDACSGFDDAADADSDGVPDGCERCPGFDDAIDGDSDGVPDGCDACPAFDNGTDCNNNGISDCDEINKDGLIGSYFSTIDLSGTPISRLDSVVDFDWGAGGPFPGYTDSYSARWTGLIRTESIAGPYEFITRTDDGARLWIDGQLVIDDWTNHPPQDTSGTIVLEANREYSITLEYYENTGGAVVQLRWLPPAHPVDVVIPAANFTANTDCGGNLVPDDCEPDADSDSVPDDCDICLGFDDSVDSDDDGVPDGCDACPGFDDSIDSDSDGVADGCDACVGFDDNIDSDGDGVADGCDVCPGFDDGLDTDNDGVADGCDICPGFDDNVDSDGDGVADGCDVCAGNDASGDADQDGVCDDTDTCPGFDDGVDGDSDGVPDGCDACPGSQSGVPVGPDGCVADSDECPVALPVSAGAFLGDLADNTGASGNDSSCGGNDPIDEWLVYTAAVDGDVIISTCDPATEFETVLSVFDACPESGGSQIDCNRIDEGCNVAGSTIWMSVSSGVTYYIRVSSADDLQSGTHYRLSIITESECGMPGDFDEDLQVGLSDLPTFITVLLDPSAADEEQFCIADINQDGEVNGLDIQNFMELATGN